MKTRQGGFSLIELMITLGVGAVVAAAIGNMVVAMKKTIVYQEDRMDALQSNNEFSSIIQSTDLCSNALGGQVFTTNSQPTIGRFGTNQNISGRVMVDRLRVTNIVNSGGNNRSADLELRLRNIHDSNILYKPQNYRIYYTVNGSNAIVTCGGGDLGAIQANCLSVGGVWNNSTSSCDTVSPMCAAFGGTMNAGSCTVAAAPSPPATPPPAALASCSAEAILSPNPLRWGPPGRCRVRAGPHGTVSGVCPERFGDCRYQCNDGNWIMDHNNCTVDDD